MRYITWYAYLGWIDRSRPELSHYSHNHHRFLVGYSDGAMVDMSEASLRERLPR